MVAGVRNRNTAVTSQSQGGLCINAIVLSGDWGGGNRLVWDQTVYKYQGAIAQQRII